MKVNIVERRQIVFCVLIKHRAQELGLVGNICDTCTHYAFLSGVPIHKCYFVRGFLEGLSLTMSNWPK